MGKAEELPHRAEHRGQAGTASGTQRSRLLALPRPLPRSSRMHQEVPMPCGGGGGSSGSGGISSATTTLGSCGCVGKAGGAQRQTPCPPSGVAHQPSTDSEDSEEEWEPGAYGLVDVPSKRRYGGAQARWLRQKQGAGSGGSLGGGSSSHRQEQQAAAPAPHGGLPRSPQPPAAAAPEHANGGSGASSGGSCRTPLVDATSRHQRTSSSGSGGSSGGGGGGPISPFAFPAFATLHSAPGRTLPMLRLPTSQQHGQKPAAAAAGSQRRANSLELYQRNDSAAFGSEFAAPL